MKNTKTKKIEFNKNLLIIVGILAALFGIVTTNAQDDVTTEVEFEEKECVWSNGVGSELYVPANKTCVIDGDILPTLDDATNPGGFTEYAVIVYPNGILQIGDTQDTTFEVNGNMLIMGDVKIYGNTDPTKNASLEVNGNVTLLNDSAEIKTFSTAGINNVKVSGTTQIGDADVGGTIDLDDDHNQYDFGHIISYKYFNIGGDVQADSIAVKNPTSGSSVTTIEATHSLNLNSYYSCGTNLVCPFDVGRDLGAGSAELLVEGTLTTPEYPSALPDVIVYGIANNGKLTVETTGTVNILDETNFGTPPYGAPDSYIAVIDENPYGLYIKGDFNAHDLGATMGGMYTINSGGSISVDSGGGGANANISDYIQVSDLYVASGDTLTINGTANIDGDAVIAGNLYVDECTKIQNDDGEEFLIESTADFQTNRDDVGCDLADTDSSDGLNVQGDYTQLNIEDGPNVDIGLNMRVMNDHYYDFVDSPHTVDADGFITIDDDLYIDDGAIVTFNDSADDFTADNLIVDPTTSGGYSAFVWIEGGTEFIIADAMKLGTLATGSTAYGAAVVDGTLTISSGSSSTSQIGTYGLLDINGDTGKEGLVSNQASGPGFFHVNGGTVTITGTATEDADLAIDDQELQMDDGTITIEAYGAIDSIATPGIGFDFDGGTLQINENGEALFDDVVDIDTNGTMDIDGLLEGTDNVYVACSGTTCKVGASGEMRVIGVDSKIIVERAFNLLGKLNGFNGSGDIEIDDDTFPATPGEINSIGEASENSYSYIYGRDIVIEENSKIDMSAFVNCYAPGTGTYGGSYGGEGTGPSGPTNATFGALWLLPIPNYPSGPNEVGMCGFTSVAGTVNENGGGGIWIRGTRDIVIDGDILANGENAVDGNTGAGSGGTIVLQHNISHASTDANFAGSGLIQANGGDGAVASSYAGGGGRILIISILYDDPDDSESGFPHYEFDGTIEAYGGQNLGGDSAAAGTIVYAGDDNNMDLSSSIAATLIVDQGESTRNPLATNTDTVLPSASNNNFFRVEARKGADIVFGAAPGTAPVSCFETGTGSSISGVTCSPNADKPDTMHINNSATTAQTVAGIEPWTRAAGGGGPGDDADIADYDPVFSVVARDPESSTKEYPKVEIQVNSASDFGAGTMLWESGDTDNPYVLDTPVSDGDRTEDIEYAGDPLTPLTTYYVRARLLDSSDTPGLWTHMDMGNEYKFTMESDYYDIENNCSDTLEVTRDGLGVNDINIGPGRRYGFGDCGFTINSTTNATWKVLYGDAPTGNGNLEGTAYSQVIDPIDNTTDTSIDTTGSSDVEKYGFHITTTGGGLSTSNVATDAGETTNKFDAWSGVNEYHIFDIEDNGSEDTILNGTSTIAAGTFDLFVRMFADINTYADDYLLDTWMILTSGP